MMMWKGKTIYVGKGFLVTGRRILYLYGVNRVEYLVY